MWSDTLFWFKFTFFLLKKKKVTIFSCVLVIYTSRKRYLFGPSTHFLIRIFFFALSYMISLYFWILTPYRKMVCKFFLLFLRLLAHLVDHFLCCAEGFFSVLYSPTYLLLLLLILLVSTPPTPPKKIIANSSVRESSTIFSSRNFTVSGLC